MTTPMQMGAEPRPEPNPAPRQQEAEAPRRAQPKDETAPQQMGAPLIRDWASI
jgi:hypothetical protein